MTKLPTSLFEHPLWEEERNPIWLGSNLILQRNLAKNKFPVKQSAHEMQNCATILVDTLKKDKTLYLPAEELSPLDKEFLFEHFLCLEGFQNADKGQGFILDETGRFLALININNHLQLQLVDTTGNLDAAWAQLVRLESDIGQKLEYAFSPNFGYLTSDPTQSGTALQAALYLHVPALHHTQHLPDLLRSQEEEILPLSLEGAIDDLTGDILILKNRYSLGISEDSMLNILQTMALRLMSAEKTLRAELKQKQDPAIKDFISRAYGLLLHSYQLQTKESLNSLSALKLGIDLGWISGISMQKINNLFFKCRHAHLAFSSKEKPTETQELAHQRATFIHQEIQGISLAE